MMFMTVCSGAGKAAEDPEECGAGVSWASGHPKLTEYSTGVIKPTRTFENIWIYYTLILVNQLHVSVTFCGHLHGVILRLKYLNIFGFILIVKHQCMVMKYLKFTENWNSLSITSYSILFLWQKAVYRIAILRAEVTSLIIIRGSSTVSTLMATCLDQTQYTLSPKIKKSQIYISWK
jgi:hypothetical protein